MDQLSQYTTNRIIELENLLLVDVEETVWPAEVKMFFLRLRTPGISRRTIVFMADLRSSILRNPY